MTMPNTFYKGTDYEQSSEPICIMDVQEGDCWPVDDRSESGTKDQLADGLHPVIAIGYRDHDRRALEPTGVVVHCHITVLGTATDRIEVDTADQKVIRQYVSNIKQYSGGSPYAYETAPFVGLAVFVDDSAALSEGVTLSMSPFNDDNQENPLAGHLWYCQDEIADGSVGGARATSTFDISLPNAETEQIYCVKLTAAKFEFAY